MKRIVNIDDWGLAMSGASVRIGILYSFLVEVWFKFKFKVIAGTSSGGLLALAAATGNIDNAMGMVLNFKMTDIFKENPFTFWGRFMMFWRVVILNKNYLQNQSSLVKTVKSVISEESFYKWQNSTHPIKVYVNAVDPETKKEHWIYLNEVSYEVAINECLMASAAIPVMTQPIYISFLRIFGYDGGWRTHVGSHFLSEQFSGKLNGICSLLSRVENIEEYNSWRLPNHKLSWKDGMFLTSFIINILSVIRFVIDLSAVTFFNGDFSTTNCWIMLVTIVTNIIFLYRRGFAIFDVVLRLFDVFNHQISEDDISNADYECDKQDIPHIKLFSPKSLNTEGIYKITPDQQNHIYETGRAHARIMLSHYQFE